MPGRREVFFEINGVPRVVEVPERAAAESGKATARRAARERADRAIIGSVAAPMAGEVVAVQIKPGVCPLAPGLAWGLGCSTLLVCLKLLLHHNHPCLYIDSFLLREGTSVPPARGSSIKGTWSLGCHTKQDEGYISP